MSMLGFICGSGGGVAKSPLVNRGSYARNDPCSLLEVKKAITKKASRNDQIIFSF